jgi:glycosyltransferase involved in cell wall biosynthesis
MYNAADVMVSASRSEGWCNAISESLAAGTPVVATDVGGNREQICSTELGHLVPDGDQGALADAIIDALSREWNQVLIAAHGSARTWKHVADHVRRVFERIVSASITDRRKEHQMSLATAAAMTEVPS